MIVAQDLGYRVCKHALAVGTRPVQEEHGVFIC
jgi:hypothetical protein